MSPITIYPQFTIFYLPQPYFPSGNHHTVVCVYEFSFQPPSFLFNSTQWSAPSGPLYLIGRQSLSYLYKFWFLLQEPISLSVFPCSHVIKLNGLTEGLQLHLGCINKVIIYVKSKKGMELTVH